MQSRSECCAESFQFVVAVALLYLLYGSAAQLLHPFLEGHVAVVMVAPLEAIR
jgi:hypothetical protein